MWRTIFSLVLLAVQGNEIFNHAFYSSSQTEPVIPDKKVLFETCLMIGTEVAISISRRVSDVSATEFEALPWRLVSVTCGRKTFAATHAIPIGRDPRYDAVVPLTNGEQDDGSGTSRCVTLMILANEPESEVRSKVSSMCRRKTSVESRTTVDRTLPELSPAFSNHPMFHTLKKAQSTVSYSDEAQLIGPQQCAISQDGMSVLISPATYESENLLNFGSLKCPFFTTERSGIVGTLNAYPRDEVETETYGSPGTVASFPEDQIQISATDWCSAFATQERRLELSTLCAVYEDSHATVVQTLQGEAVTACELVSGDSFFRMRTVRELDLDLEDSLLLDDATLSPASSSNWEPEALYCEGHGRRGYAEHMEGMLERLGSMADEFAGDPCLALRPDSLSGVLFNKLCKRQ